MPQYHGPSGGHQQHQNGHPQYPGSQQQQHGQSGYGGQHQQQHHGGQGQNNQNAEIEATVKKYLPRILRRLERACCVVM